MANFLEGLLVFNHRKEGNNRSVMPLDVLGRTHATLTMSTSLILGGGLVQRFDSVPYGH